MIPPKDKGMKSGISHRENIMNPYNTIFTHRVQSILDKYKYITITDTIEDTRKFLYEVLMPTPERKRMIYRYEHTLRVARNGEILADAEGFPREQLIIACLLHDVGYGQCETREDFNNHQFLSADIAKVYLENIGYEKEMSEEIVKGVALHNLKDKLPEDMSLFQMAVRDSDDIDRYDMMRTAILLGDCVYDKSDDEIIIGCQEAINNARWSMAFKRCSKTALQMVTENCEKRIAILQDIIDLAKKGESLHSSLI